MKKAISLLLVTVMLVFTLSSCDIINGLFGKGEKTTITKEEWEALYEITNYTAEMNATYTYTYEGENTTVSMNVIRKYSEIAAYEKTSTDPASFMGNDGEAYYVTKNEGYYEIRQAEDGKWYSSKNDDWEPQSLSGITSGLEFEDLIYDENEKAYVFSKTDDGMTMSFMYYFVNGELVKAFVTQIGDMNGTRMEMTTTAIISNIGSTVVDLPAYSPAPNVEEPTPIIPDEEYAYPDEQ